MRWRTAPIALDDWHRWFAWFPVTMVDGSRAWLEPVARRALSNVGDSPHGPVFQYSEIVG